MRSLRVECDRLIYKHMQSEDAQQMPNAAPQAETSSAYNTGGESCRSATVTPDGCVPLLLHHQRQPMQQANVQKFTPAREDPRRECCPPSPSHVKRRCDGTRYVVKRPVRNQVLKKREAQLNKERTGISTDDDAFSGVKLGHYFCREDRKKQLEHERMRKIRHEQRINQAKLANTDKLIVDMAYRKMARRQAPLDAFTSTREYLSQRHEQQGPPPPAPILAVTTV
ncbi:unnamed protein product, partial [Mesorhabditis spiculigera]